VNYNSKEKELAGLQEELCAKKRVVKETQCSFKYQIQTEVAPRFVFQENLEIQLLLLQISDWIKGFFLVRLIARRELFVEIVNYVLSAHLNIKYRVI
jgi:hypothetical protein